jgi:hypothetical protein
LRIWWICVHKKIKVKYVYNIYRGRYIEYTTEEEGDIEKTNLSEDMDTE